VANAEGKANRLVRPHEEYLCLGPDPLGRQQAYRALFEAHLDEAFSSPVGWDKSKTNPSNELCAGQTVPSKAKPVDQRLSPSTVRGKSACSEIVVRPQWHYLKGTVFLIKEIERG
jgi:hypothetical protein